ncbi:MAG: hypothetical protein RMJ98_05580, partial [Myxococcales bacterium]|nr:hypothetical protein [Polyangiaceae bacterium]MDW8248762.1 hypothetical protein [Myxococcales bacterium]
MSRRDRVLAYALAVWLIRLDGVVTTEEKVNLRTLGNTLELPDGVRSRISAAAFEVVSLPQGDRPERYDFQALQARLQAKLGDLEGELRPPLLARLPAVVASDEVVHIVPLEQGPQHLREHPRGASHARYANLGEPSGQPLVIGRDATITEGQKAESPDPTLRHRLHAPDELRFVAPLEEVGDQQQQGPLRVVDQALAVADGAMDIGAAPKLNTEEEVH